jgi:hypothetical protein
MIVSELGGGGCTKSLSKKNINDHFFQILNKVGKNSYVKRGFLNGAHKISFEKKT